MHKQASTNDGFVCRWPRFTSHPVRFRFLYSGPRARQGAPSASTCANSPDGGCPTRSRRYRYVKTLAMLALCLVLAGCTQVKPQADFAQARKLITETTGVETVFNPEVPLLTGEELDAILADGLTLDESLRAALLNNRQLHAEFMSIGVAKADWVQAGLLSNPTLGLSVQFPEGGGRSNIQTSIAQNITDLWQIPRRKRVAQATLDETILRIAHVAARLVTDTETAYFQAVSADELLALARKNLELVSKSHQAVKAQREAGMVSMLDENLALGEALSAELEVRNARLAAANAKRSLAKLMSVGRRVGQITLSDPLPGTFDSQPTPQLTPDELIELARASRLDLRALENAVRARLADIEVEKLRVFSDISLGLAFERPERRGESGRDVAADFARSSIANGAFTAPDIQSRRERRAAESEEIDTILGPSLNLTLPIFDQNQAQIAKAEYLHLQELKTYEALFIRIAQDIRTAADEALTAMGNAGYYRDELVPQAERNLEFANASYSLGQTNILILIEAQRLAVEAQRGYIEVRLAASSALSDLEQAVGMPAEKMNIATQP